jgi:transposase
MNFKEGTCRHQTYFATLDEQVAADNPVRLIDAFVDKLQLQKVGFTNTSCKREGRPPFDPDCF